MIKAGRLVEFDGRTWMVTGSWLNRSGTNELIIKQFGKFEEIRDDIPYRMRVIASDVQEF